MSGASDLEYGFRSEQELVEAVDGRHPIRARVQALKELSRRPSAVVTRVLTAAIGERTAAAELRIVAAVALGRGVQPEHREALTSALGDPDPGVVRRAAEGLGRMGDQSSLEPLAAAGKTGAPAAAAAIAFAQTLISYRLSLGTHRVTEPPREAMLSVREPVDLKIDAPDERRVEAIRRSLEASPAGVALTVDAPVLLNCGGDELAILLNQEIASAKDPKRAGAQDAVAAVVLKHFSRGAWAPLEYIFLHAAENGAALLGVRPNGPVTRAGTARFKAKAAEFELRTANTLYAPASEIAGRWTAGAPGIELTRAVADRRLAPEQARPRVPLRSR